MKVLGVVVAVLLAANLVNEAYSSNTNTAETSRISSTFGSCQLPASLTRENMDTLASDVVEALKNRDDARFFELHKKYPQPTNDAEREKMDAGISFVRNFTWAGHLGPVTEKSFQSFEYLGDTDNAETFKVVYHLAATNIDYFDWVQIKLLMSFDGTIAGLAKTEIKFVKSPG